MIFTFTDFHKKRKIIQTDRESERRRERVGENVTDMIQIKKK